MKIYEKPTCFVCKESAICIYAGEWICGRCLEKIKIKEQEGKKKILMEIRCADVT